ncbi:MAG TPA: peptidylprolyl isomerase [Candidatus Cloacimonadota bacterium]|nr:peptidylprolyl isomerase [Candidatus Cloacimonadota bacterium]HOR58724.1 peptidylprolyl isomerase [Candidatus Cloacimonadota bacterium]HPB08123.1 peptidylprolyl isomerase [Candidatus Cloacimonadota bacterium]HQO44120.1 peptidylprolyl isomerase [Candidatus Cloacimonadota bacterium]HQP17508.1 peptidylprolyl isomerase [Candidatus Cloacimonadota bacterium]
MKNTIVKILFLAFTLAALTACAANQENLAGKINGTPILYSDYIESYRGHYNNFQILNNRAPDAIEKEALKSQTWTNATKHVVLNDYFKKYRISASSQEVLDTLRVNIPDYILRSPLFNINSKFDRAVYLQSLEFDTPHNLQPLRRQYRDYYIPVMKLKEKLIDDLLLTSKEKKLGTRILQSKADIEWLVLDARNIQPVITEEQLRYEYEQNLPQYKLEPYYSLNYFRVPVKFSKTDIRRSYELADSLFQELVLGEDIEAAVAKRLPYFPQLTLKNSGYIRNNDLDPDLYASFSFVEEGSYLNPLSDQDGVTIYRLDKRTKSMSSFTSIRVPYLPSEASINFTLPEAQNLRSLVKDLGINAAAEELDLNYVSTGNIRPDAAWLDDPSVVEAVNLELSGKKPGYAFKPIYSEAQRCWIVACLNDTRLEAYKPIEEVRQELTEALTLRKRADMARHQASQIIAGNSSYASAAQKLMLPAMTYQTKLLEHNADSIFFNVMHAHYSKSKQQYHELGDLILIPRVTRVICDKDTKASSADIRRLFKSTLDPEWFDDWLDNEVAKADLRIYADI